MKGDIANTPLSQINTMAGSDRSMDSQIADIADNNIVNSSGQELSDFYKSVITCIKTLSNDLTLSVGVGEDVSDGNYDVTLPLIADEKNQSLVALIRGLGDSFAMMLIGCLPCLNASVSRKWDHVNLRVSREIWSTCGRWATTPTPCPDSAPPSNLNWYFPVCARKASVGASYRWLRRGSSNPFVNRLNNLSVLQYRSWVISSRINPATQNTHY